MPPGFGGLAITARRLAAEYLKSKLYGSAQTARSSCQDDRGTFGPPIAPPQNAGPTFLRSRSTIFLAVTIADFPLSRGAPSEPPRQNDWLPHVPVQFRENNCPVA